jgi:hypothetical protein
MQYPSSRTQLRAVVLCYKPEGRGSNSYEVIAFFNLPNPSSRTMALGFTEPLTETR